LLTGIRHGRWSGADADSAAVLLRRLPVRRVAEDHAHAFELARRYENWPVDDMVYVAIAERAGTEFVTADARLRARLAHLGWVKLPAEITPVTARPPRNIHEAPDPGIALCIQSPINCTCAKRSIFRANYRRGRR
jgi:hypothetical protein